MSQDSHEADPAREGVDQPGDTNPGPADRSREPKPVTAEQPVLDQEPPPPGDDVPSEPVPAQQQSGPPHEQPGAPQAFEQPGAPQSFEQQPYSPPVSHPDPGHHPQHASGQEAAWSQPAPQQAQQAYGQPQQNAYGQQPQQHPYGQQQAFGQQQPGQQAGPFGNPQGPGQGQPPSFGAPGPGPQQGQGNDTLKVVLAVVGGLLLLVLLLFGAWKAFSGSGSAAGESAGGEAHDGRFSVVCVQPDALAENAQTGHAAGDPRGQLSR